MSISAVTSIASIDPTVKFTTPQAYIDQLNNLVTTTIDDTITPYILGSATPGVDDQDKVWHRTDSAGRFLGTYIFYNGFWVLPAPPLGARIGMWSGDPTDASMWDANGKGLPGAGPIANDTYGWQIANGHNGTANLSDQFIIGARMDNVGITGWDAGTQLWRTNVTGAPLTQGGVAEITTDATNTYRPATNAITSAKYSADGNVQGGALWGDVNGSTDFTIQAADAGQLAPDAISTVPPFYALAFIAYIGLP